MSVPRINKKYRSRNAIARDVWEAYQRKPRPSLRRLSAEFDCHIETVKKCLEDYGAAVSQPRTPKLTTQEVSYLQGLAKGKTRYDAAVAAGIKGPKRISEFIEVTESNAITRQCVADALSAVEGGDPDAVARNIVDLMRANRQVVVGGRIKSVPDNTTRVKATQLAANIHTKREEQEAEDSRQKDKLPPAAGMIVLTAEQLERFRLIRGDGYVPGLKSVSDDVVDSVAIESGAEVEKSADIGDVEPISDHPLAMRGVSLLDSQKTAATEGRGEEKEPKGAEPVQGDPD